MSSYTVKMRESLRIMSKKFFLTKLENRQLIFVFTDIILSKRSLVNDIGKDTNFHDLENA